MQGKAYHWHDWNICRGRDCLYVWSDSAALELSNGSNGWFRFILDGKLATMYSSGSPENGNDNSGILSLNVFSFFIDYIWLLGPFLFKQSVGLVFFFVLFSFYTFDKIINFKVMTGEMCKHIKISGFLLILV